MNFKEEKQTPVWPLWRKVILRFFFIYFLFQISPWGWLYSFPGIGYITQYYDMVMDWAVRTSNAKIFHVRQVLILMNGSGDTSYGWAELWLWLSLAFTGCIIWSFADARRKNYAKLNYWLCVFARYYLAYFAFFYGFLKIFMLQMPFPTLHQLATPLGDLLPMRLSWMFIGYSSTYQVFSGLMEIIAGILLLNKRTATLGFLVATGVFINVMMLNLSYDIPVKIFSMQLVLVCLFLLANEAGRLYSFFVLNKPAPISSTYALKYPKKWMSTGRFVLKIGFIIIAIVLPFLSTLDNYKSFHKAVVKQQIKNGIYEVTTFAVNKRIISISMGDSLRWQDVIFEDGTGSIKTADTIFRQRYRRGYFAYTTDKTHKIYLKKQKTDSLAFMSFRF